MRRAIGWIGVGVLALGACTPDGSQATTTSQEVVDGGATQEEPGLYLMLMWHQHQPFYPKNPDGVYTRPWVRVHATKDYWDMAALVEEHPGIEVTFNLTPVLLLQLEDLAGGAKDTYWVASEAAADSLTIDEKTFIAERFFDVNPGVISRFPRFQELADQRAELGVEGVVAKWGEGEFRDLQVLFNLAWTDPELLAAEPLASMVRKERAYAEEDKEILFAEHLRIIQEVIPLHARLWEEGRIEVTTTPLAHPILPLLGDTDLAVAGDPAALLPESRFREIADADQQVIRGLDVAERLLGQRPVGMWPGEGSVAQLIMNLFSKNGVQWVATGEDVLAQTLGFGSFERDATDKVIDASSLYGSYAAQVPSRDPVAMFFRDVRISDQIGFEYSGMDADAAVADFMDRLRAIHDDPAIRAAAESGKPAVVSVILDGENAWENYPNDGRDFLDALYTALEATDWVETTTPSRYLSLFPDPSPLGPVFPASWFQPNFATWIGEPEEATAWDYLYQARQDLRRAEQSGEFPEADLEAALEAMLFAEGSDWFWWYGADQESGNDTYFDEAFRELLGQVYDALGQPRPTYISVPIIPQQPLVADRAPAALATIIVDGIDGGEWDNSGRYEEAGVGWAFDKENLYLRYDGTAAEGDAIYLGSPNGRKVPTSIGGDVLGFGATSIVLFSDGGASLCEPPPLFEPEECLELISAGGQGLTEIAIPLGLLGPLEPGDLLLAKLDLGGLVPDRPLAFQVPDISNVAVFLDVADPIGDDHGPGTYTYPTDTVFAPGSYDLEGFQVGTEEDEVVFVFDVASPIGNPWGSPSGLALQTFDVYIDTDPGAGTGSRVLIPGRNAALDSGSGWEYGITIEGWQPAIYVAGADGSLVETEPTISVAVFSDDGRVVARVPAEALGGGDPTTWGYTAVLLSQEGFPTPGVRRVRDINVVAEQWRGGGAPNDINHTRIFDVAWPTEGDQEAWLSAYPSTGSGTVDSLGPDDFANIPLLLVPE